MNRYRILVLLLVASCFAYAQEETSGVKSAIGASSTNKSGLAHNITTSVNGQSKSVTINSVSVQVGMPYMGVIDAPFSNSPDEQNYIKDLGFPWGIRYRYSTFSEDSFTVSKGYYSDRIELNWKIKANQDNITSISVYRTEDVNSDKPYWGSPLKTIAADAGTFVDTNVEGGKLYRYKLFASGVEEDDLEVKYSSYITGIGYRNPTGIITGSIAYSGGTPVKDVIVSANPTGDQLSFGSSLKIPFNSYLLVAKFHENLKDSITLQTWLKPETDLYDSELTLYKLYSDHAETLDLKVKMTTENSLNKLTVSIGNYSMTLTDYIPSGDIDNKGEDVLIPITNMNSSFTHFSAVLRDQKTPEFYINGRIITEDYASVMNGILAKNNETIGKSVVYSSNAKTIDLNTSTKGYNQTWNYFSVGGGINAYFDELRVWSSALDSNLIKRDFKRYLKGNETYFHTYIRANEGKGDYAYDLAHSGYSYHGNDARLSNSPVTSTWATRAQDIPTSSQLAVLGITDEHGNYEISAIPYSGNGQSFTIIPTLGKHAFNPSQELAYIGANSSVVNNVDFTDKSSFIFKGNVVYDSRGVFPATSDEPITGDIKEGEVYNAYTVGNLTYQKGEYWAEKDENGNITKLLRYAKIPVPNAYVYIDDLQVIDENNVPIQTDVNGQFTIEVPIGKHAITIRKTSHDFEFEGRFPAKTSEDINGETFVTNTYVDFYEDRDVPITFIDNTKVIVVGRVVGGNVEADKPIGFGFDGEKIYSSEGAIDVVYTSKNNIGKAKLTLGYMPVGATSITPEYETSFTTNSVTGEYRVSILPLKYTLSKNNLNFVSGKNPDDKLLLESDKVVNYSEIKSLTYPSYSINNQTITGDQPYQEILSFTHLTAPESTVLNQTCLTSYEKDGKTYQIDSLQRPLLYMQLNFYAIKIKTFESYYNYDESLTEPSVDEVAVKDRELIVTNNLAREQSGTITYDVSEDGITLYIFQGGLPNTDAEQNYKRTIDLKMRVNEIDYPIANYESEGIVLGGIEDGSNTFMTAGPDQVDFILRDPPGSSSSATIEKGSSFSFVTTGSYSHSDGNTTEAELNLGNKWEVGGGTLGPLNSTEYISDRLNNISVQVSSSRGTDIEKTYTFNQSISTSDEPQWVGSDADLYIGTAANIYYGTFDNLVLSDSVSETKSSDSIKVTDEDGNELEFYPTVEKGFSFVESEDKTIFVYSQHTILEEIIPKQEEILEKLRSGELTQNEGNVKDTTYYKSNINLWRQTILQNELTKYQAYNDREGLKTSIESLINDLKESSDTKDGLRSMLNETFFKNISFDTGTGEFTQSYEIEGVKTKTHITTTQIDEEIGGKLGLKWNEKGFEIKTLYTRSWDHEEGDVNSQTNTLNVSYSFADYDEFNIHSVDVINSFDGNGPIFITKAGETSCPYEGSEKSHFYNPDHENVTNPDTDIKELNPLTESMDLSVGTIALEIPELTVEVASVSNIPDGRNAEYVLKLRNVSTIENEALFRLKVDQTTNPHNADINIDSDGVELIIPSGETIEYTVTLAKVVEDQFDYEDIRIYLESACGGVERNSFLVNLGTGLRGEVFLSAHFVPACSPVTITAPDENWLMNRNTTFTGDETNPVMITLSEYNTEFESLNKISLEYRYKGTPNWIGLKTYYKDEEAYNDAISGGDTNVALIDGAQLNYAWDIAGLGLADGDYELRARTDCYNGTGFVSETIEGSIDLTSPVLFGTPTPKNGILGLGDDLSLRFNEPVKKNGTVSKFEFLVQKNQLAVNHEVSLAFNGQSNSATIQRPSLSNGDFSIEFWLKNTSGEGSSTLISQQDGIKVTLINDKLNFSVGAVSIEREIMKDNSFNHYALTYNDTQQVMSIFENGDLKFFDTVGKVLFANSNPIVIGGSSFSGNIHDLRIWKKTLSKDDTSLEMNNVLTGHEKNLIGYWPMNEGHGDLAYDIARYKHLIIENANWDIKPKGFSYEFNGENYLDFDQMSKVIITNEMDATLSFWMKSNQHTNATLISNGTHDYDDDGIFDKVDVDVNGDGVIDNGADQDNDGIKDAADADVNGDGEIDNGIDVDGNGVNDAYDSPSNTWNLDLENGILVLHSEGDAYSFGNRLLNDDSWHHIAMSLSRNGTIRMYIDGDELSSYASTAIGGFESGHLFVGARGHINNDTSIEIDRYYKGMIDELRIWNSSRTADQILEDQYFEVDLETTGLLFYSPFNVLAPTTSSGPSGPKYYYPVSSSSGSKLSSYANVYGELLPSEVTPGVKPYRPTESLNVNAIISGSELLLNPDITDWASVEGKIATITVSGLNDLSDNKQASPVTWSTYISKNPVKWFVEGHSDIVHIVHRTEKGTGFEITLVNQGGAYESFSIDAPSWLTLSSKSGTLDPNSTLTISAVADEKLATGDYNEVLSLTTDYGFNEQIHLEFRVLAVEPDFSFDPSAFTKSMNIIGKVKIDEIFTNDIYDKVIVKVGEEVRGVGSVLFDEDLNEYFVYITVYSNADESERLSFYIWDAEVGKLREALLNDELFVDFVENEIIGTYLNPAIIKNTDVETQEIPLNKGWNWVSFNVQDPDFDDLNALTKELDLSTSDIIQSNAPALFDAYQKDDYNPDNSGWSGSLSAYGGVNVNRMYKIKVAKAQNFVVKGVPVDLSDWYFEVTENWNWLPFVGLSNQPIKDALANFDASEGDLIKSQNEFAIYSAEIGWKGSLDYLDEGVGYMLKSAKAQQFSYPIYLDQTMAKYNNSSKGIESDLTHDDLIREFNSYPSTMSAVVKLPLGYNQIAFYDQNMKLRGIANTREVNGESLAFVTLHGDQTEELIAFIGSESKELTSTAHAVSFSNNSILGSLKEPYIIELLKDKVTFYPNPFTDHFELAIKSDESTSAELIITNLNNQMVFRETVELVVGENLVKRQVNVQTGVYVLRIIIGDTTLVSKIVKQ